MKIAFATQDLVSVDAHFGSAKHIRIYEMDQDGAFLLETHTFDGNLQEDGNEDKLAPKLASISECAILYVAAIGGSAASRVIAQAIHPIRVTESEPIDGLLDSLQALLRGTPPPWLRKALGKGKERILDFEEEEVAA